jgi:hypothetical protein
MLDAILAKHGFDIRERPAQGQTLCCPRCATFYTKRDAPSSELVPDKKSITGAREVYFCNCHNSREQLNDAHEVGFDTPAMLWEYDALTYIERKLDRERDEVLNMLNNYYSR